MGINKDIHMVTLDASADVLSCVHLAIYQQFAPDIKDLRINGDGPAAGLTVTADSGSKALPSALKSVISYAAHTLSASTVTGYAFACVSAGSSPVIVTPPSFSSSEE